MVKSLVLFSKLQLVHSEWSFSRGQILFYLARIQDIHVARWLLYVCLHHEKALFLYFSRSLLISLLFDNPESGKRNYRFGKKSGKVLNFGSKNLYEPNPDSTYSETWKTTKNINQMSVVTPSVYITLPSLCDASIAHYFICKLQLAPTNIRTKYSTQCCKLSLKSPNCR